MTGMDANRTYVESLYQAVFRRAPRVDELEHWTAVLDKGYDPRQLLELFFATEEFKQIARRPQTMFVPPGHFYSPIVDVDKVRERYGELQPNVAPPAIAIDGARMRRTWSELLPFLRDIPFPEDPQPPWRYYFRNPAFGHGDGSLLHAMLRRYRPRRLVEVGSGYSSACSIDTIDHYLDGAVDVSFVEPYPALLLKTLGKEKASQYTIHASGAQDTSMEVFERLEAGDFLFIDSTHVMKTGSDVCHELFKVLPALQPGVFIHFHDIFWPFEYLPSWIVNENRSWNEIYGMRAFLMYNNAFEIVFFNDYFARNHRDLIAADYPAMLENTGGSLWLRKTGS